MKPELCDAHLHLQKVSAEALRLFARLTDGYAATPEREQLRLLLVELWLALEKQAIQDCSVSRQLAILKSVPQQGVDLELVACGKCNGLIGLIGIGSRFRDVPVPSFGGCSMGCPDDGLLASQRPVMDVSLARFRHIESVPYPGTA